MRHRYATGHEKDVPMDKARQLVKVAAVILRDHSMMPFEEAALAFAYCWNHTESVDNAEAREATDD